MNYQIGFLIDSKITHTSVVIIKDYSWWVDLIKNIGNVANNFEIRCWEGESDAIEVGMRYGNLISNLTTSELVYKGKITDEFLGEITSSYLTDKHSIKWFTLILYIDDTSLFSSEHYGSEPHLYNIPKEQIQQIKSWAANYPCIMRVDVYEYNGDNNENTVIS